MRRSKSGASPLASRVGPHPPQQTTPTLAAFASHHRMDRSASGARSTPLLAPRNPKPITQSEIQDFAPFGRMVAGGTSSTLSQEDEAAANERRMRAAIRRARKTFVSHALADSDEALNADANDDEADEDAEEQSKWDEARNSSARGAKNLLRVLRSKARAHGGLIDRDTFAEALVELGVGMESQADSDALFDTFDGDASGTIDLHELKTAFSMILDPRPPDYDAIARPYELVHVRQKMSTEVLKLGAKRQVRSSIRSDEEWARLGFPINEEGASDDDEGEEEDGAGSASPGSRDPSVLGARVIPSSFSMKKLPDLP